MALAAIAVAFSSNLDQQTIEEALGKRKHYIMRRLGKDRFFITFFVEDHELAKSDLGHQLASSGHEIVRAIGERVHEHSRAIR